MMEQDVSGDPASPSRDRASHGAAVGVSTLRASPAIARCQTCRHWSPLFSGEQWGVRSFADAPEVERARVLAEIKARHDAEGYGWDASDDFTSPSPPSGIDVDAPPGPEWPMWGECALTEMGHGKPPSLARAMDGSEYYAILRCHASFGCVQHLAQGIAARSGETALAGSTEGKSPVAESDVP